MEIVIAIATVVFLALGATFFLTKSSSKAKSKKINATEMTLKTYTKQEVSRHKTREDCWIIVKDKVYDVTPYVEEHPDGDAILNNAGNDSIEGFHGFSAAWHSGLRYGS